MEGFNLSVFPKFVYLKKILNYENSENKKPIKNFPFYACIPMVPIAHLLFAKLFFLRKYTHQKFTTILVLAISLALTRELFTIPCSDHVKQFPALTM
jgi:hypothetical protein